MKKGLLIWNIALTGIVGYLIYTQFSAGKKPAPPEVSKSASTLIETPPAPSAFRIAYFEMDSIETNLLIVQDLKIRKSRKEEENTRVIDEMKKKFQQKFEFYQTQAQSGKLSAAQSEAATAEMKKLDDDIRDKRLELDSDLNEFVARNQNDIQKKIEGFLKEYNKEKNYAYIFVNERGLFYYCDTAYNITNDVVKGLNAEFKKAKRD